MKISEIKQIIETAKLININDINCKDKVNEHNLKTIYQFVQKLDELYLEVIERLINSNIRFCDYYDPTMLHEDQIINYFNNTYNGDNLETASEEFSLFVILKNVSDLIYNFDICDNWDDLYELLNNEKYFEDIMYNISYLEEKKKLDENQPKMDFLNEANKYKIFFTGFAFDDIQKLEKNIKKAFINKISGQLSTSDIITLAECVDHVKDAYDFPIFRVQFSNDYRIVYLRRNNVTAILGVAIKTGKPSDYTRYDALAKREDEIYAEIDMFSTGALPDDSDHYKTIQYLDEFYKKII